MGAYARLKTIILPLEKIFAEEEIVDKLLEIDISQIYHFIGLFKKALRKYIVWKKSNISIDDFIKKCVAKNFRQAQELGWDYYCANGGYETNCHFLFGKASQFRLNSS